MRVLLLLRGGPGCGKSTWIEQNGLKQYTLSSDDIRMLCASPHLNKYGGQEISQENDNVVWSTLFKLLEVRMTNGEFTVIDATNSKTSEMNRYKELCAQHKYRMYCVDFTDVPVEVVKERNRNREPLKRVPDEVIDKMYSRFATQKIPSGITVLKPDELERIWMKPIDLSSYQHIHVIGDVHGCNTVLQQYINESGGISPQDFYVFCGDYIDRGIENAEVVRFLLSIYNLPNVMLLEGNHERWLWVYANGGVARSREFEISTVAQLDSAGISKKDLRQLFRRFAQCAYFTYVGNTYLVTHGGLSCLPDNLTKVSTRQIIHGVGSYNEAEDVDATFCNVAPNNCYQIHGHRNVKNVHVGNGRAYNLEGHVEFGGSLRVLRLNDDGSHNVFELQNTVFRVQDTPDETVASEMQTVGDMIMYMRSNKYVQEKRYGNISSFNFTKTAFYEGVWDDQTVKARGLYINVPKQKVVARAYDKFFNINERNETKLDMLQYKLQFPVRAYVKENGFMGIVSYNEETDDLLITTKSSPDGDAAVLLRCLMETRLGTDKMEKMKQFSKENNVSFVFECVDMAHDPHVISYPESELFLLDIVYNDMHMRKMDYTPMCEVANQIGLKHKELAYELETWQEFFDWYYMVTGDEYLYEGRQIEGFVLEDASGYMLKVKLAYYHFWKYMRGIAHETLRKGYINPKKTSGLMTPLANQFYGFMKTLYTQDDKAAIPQDICTLRDMFYKTAAGKQFAEE